MSGQATRIRVLFTKTHASRGYSSVPNPSRNTYSPKSNTHKIRGPFIPPRKPKILDRSNDMPPRSFILDRPTKPPLKRVSPSKQKSITPSTYEKKIASNPYAAILAAPIRQCIYTRLILPNTFLTKIIQAAGPNDTPWIVPERILPHAITKISTSESNQEQLRNGPGKWVRTTFDVIDSVVKEGRYKIITTSGFMRTDMSKLIYAQWSIRVAHEFRELFKASTLKSTKTQSSIRQSRFVILDGSHAHPPGSQMSVKTNVTNGNADDDEEKTDLKSILEFRSAQNMEIPCVLYFDKGLQTAFKQVELDSENQENNEATQNRDQNIIQKKPSEIAIATLLGLEQLNEIDITKPTLPASTKDQQPKSERMEVWHSNGRKFRSPVYDMERLFQHHPQGLKVIKLTCLGLLPNAHARSRSQDTKPVWIGIQGSSGTIPACVGLWKMASM